MSEIKKYSYKETAKKKQLKEADLQPLLYKILIKYLKSKKVSITYAENITQSVIAFIDLIIAAYEKSTGLGSAALKAFYRVSEKIKARI